MSNSKKVKIEEVLSENITPVAQKIDADKIHKIALRRTKVRELSNMGYKIAQICRILENGIKVGEVGKQKTIKVNVSKKAITKDLEYIKQEGLSEDVDFAEKRFEVKEKLDFLYQRAVTEYINAKGSVRATFMNTALSILNKIMEMEGVKAPENLNVNLNAEARIAKFSAEIHKLSKDDKSTILAAIRKVREGSRGQGVGNTGVSSDKSRIPTQTSNDEGVPRKS